MCGGGESCETLPGHHWSPAEKSLSSAVWARVPSNPDPTTATHRHHTPCLSTVRWRCCSALCSESEHQEEELRLEKLLFPQKPVCAGFISCITSARQGWNEEWCLRKELSDCSWRKVASLLTFSNFSIMSSMQTSAVCNTLLSICTSHKHSSLLFSLNTIQVLSLSLISCLRRDTYG